MRTRTELPRRAAPLLAGLGLLACASAPAQPQDQGALVPPEIGARVQQELRAPPEERALLADPAALLRRLARQNPALAAERARVEQARSALDQSALYPDPTLGAGAGGAVGERNPSTLGWNDTTNWNVGLQQPIEIGKREPRIAAARLRLSEEELHLADLAGDLSHQARAALGREVYLRARLALMQESLAAAQQMLDVEHGRLQNGDMSSNDFDRLTLDTTLLELELPRTQSDHDAALADLHALLGSDCPLEPGGAEALAHSAPVPETADLEAALAVRADLRAIDLERQASDEDARLAHARALPDPVIGLGYTHDNLTSAGNQPNSLELTVGLRLPFFDRGQHDARRAEQHSLELSHGLDASLRSAESEARSLIARQATLAKVLERLDGEALPKSRQVLETSTTAFNRGQVSLTDVLLARRTHTDLLLREIDLAFDSFGARNDLRHALGIDSELFSGLQAEAKP